MRKERIIFLKKSSVSNAQNFLRIAIATCRYSNNIVAIWKEKMHDSQNLDSYNLTTSTLKYSQASARLEIIILLLSRSIHENYIPHFDNTCAYSLLVNIYCSLYLIAQEIFQK